MLGFGKGKKAKAEREARTALANTLYGNARKAAAIANYIVGVAERPEAQDEEVLAGLQQRYSKVVGYARGYMAEADLIEAELIWELPTVPEPTGRLS